MADFDIKQLIKKAHFDYVGPFFPSFRDQDSKLFVLPDLKNINASRVNGNPYFMRVKFAYQGEQFLLPNEPLVALSLSKTIVETATVGTERKGTVKEYITTDDYQISFRGVCFDENDPEAYPATQVEELDRLFNINAAIEVIDSKFFELFGIRKVVIKDIQYDEMVGYPGAQRYIMTAVSDQDFYADLNNQATVNLLN
ncbi:MAG: DUF6046 domain-containing protein [Psychroserpens sp.]|uniref:DUF6046 domain-containing protein n=1 Tax=Psychroserpens sp. TaxID=2020870 RepID=UPI003CB84A4E